MNNETLPRIYTARLLEMKDGETLFLEEGLWITCLDAYRKTFDFDDGTEYFNESVSMAYSEPEGLWYNARYDDRTHQYKCTDLRPEFAAVYAVARTLKALWGVRTYKSAGVLIRSVMRRRELYG